MQTPLHRGSTIGVGTDAGFLVVAHGRGAPSHEDWLEVCRAIRSLQDSARGLVVISLGGAPNAEQRRRALSQLREGFKPPPMAILTDIALHHGVVTVMNWFLQNQQRAFHTNDVDGVANHLTLSTAQAKSLIDFAHALLPTP